MSTDDAKPAREWWVKEQFWTSMAEGQLHIAYTWPANIGQSVHVIEKRALDQALCNESQLGDALGTMQRIINGLRVELEQVRAELVDVRQSYRLLEEQRERFILGLKAAHAERDEARARCERLVLALHSSQKTMAVVREYIEPAPCANLIARTLEFNENELTDYAKAKGDTNG